MPIDKAQEQEWIDNSAKYFLTRDAQDSAYRLHEMYFDRKLSIDLMFKLLKRMGEIEGSDNQETSSSKASAIVDTLLKYPKIEEEVRKNYPEYINKAVSADKNTSKLPAIVEAVEENGVEKKVVSTRDLQQVAKSLIEDPQKLITLNPNVLEEALKHVDPKDCEKFGPVLTRYPKIVSYLTSDQLGGVLKGYKNPNYENLKPIFDHVNDKEQLGETLVSLVNQTPEKGIGTSLEVITSALEYVWINKDNANSEERSIDDSNGDLNVRYVINFLHKKLGLQVVEEAIHHTGEEDLIAFYRCNIRPELDSQQTREDKSSIDSGNESHDDRSSKSVSSTSTATSSNLRGENHTADRKEVGTLSPVGTPLQHEDYSTIINKSKNNDPMLY